MPVECHAEVGLSNTRMPPVIARASGPAVRGGLIKERSTDMDARQRLTNLLFASLLLSGTAAAGSELSSASCRLDFAAVDNQADKDIADINRLIALLESEIEDPALASSGQDFTAGLRAKITAAKLHRSQVFDKQHDDLNVIRDRCDRVWGDTQRSGASDGLKL